MRQEIILLCFVEMVNLVDEKNGGLAGSLEVLRFLHDLFEILDAGSHGRKIDRDGVGRLGDEPRQRGFAAARRAPEYQRAEFSGVQHAAQKLSRAEQMLLANELFQTGGAHFFRERLGG